MGRWFSQGFLAVNQSTDRTKKTCFSDSAPRFEVLICILGPG